MISKLFRHIRRRLITKSGNRKKIFTNIYEEKIWGGESEAFYSGSGSHKKQYVEPYVMFLKNFIAEHNVDSAVDLGCGDFNIGSQFAYSLNEYIGVDIVDNLIEHNNKEFSCKNVRFLCLDICNDDLPDANLCIIRQVLQHLKNNEIQLVINNTKKYKYVLVTESVTKKEYVKSYNSDIEDDRYTRPNHFSGVYLNEAPFSVECTIVNRIDYNDTVELVTYLIEHTV